MKVYPHNIETSYQVSDGSSESMTIEMLPPDSLKRAARNARTHSKKQVRQIADSILQFGMINPAVVDDRGRIVAGHARVEAAKLIGLKTMPVIRVTHLSETKLRAYALADNKLPEKAGWDRELLSIELSELQIALPQIALDVGITGFEPVEVDSIISDFEETKPNPLDQLPDIPATPVSKLGDLFNLGKHRLIAGDARDPAAYSRLMGSETAMMSFLDPPYNVKILGHVGGRGRTKHREFKQAAGEMSSPQFTAFLEEAFSRCAQHTVDGGITFVCMDWRHVGELLAAGNAAYDELKNVCVWVKTTPGQGTFYRSQHELIFIYKKGKEPHLNTFELGQHGRTRTNVWSYPGANSFRAGRMDELRMHPTVKPVALIADAMKDCSRRGSIILDSFAGSGTSIVAAEQTGRRAYCMEIDPLYIDVAIRRWQRMS